MEKARLDIVFVGSSSMGPYFIMGYLKKHGFNCDGVYQGINLILGGGGQQENYKKPISLDDLIALNPRIVGFSSCSMEYTEMKEAAQALKLKKPEILIMFGGIHPTILPDEVVAEDCIDIVCCGEGEIAVLELCKSLKEGKNITSIKGLWVKQYGKVFKNGYCEPHKNLDDFELDRSNIEKYNGIFSSRGCYGSCSFCNTPTIRKLSGCKKDLVRKRSVESVLNEVDYVLSQMTPNYDLKRIFNTLDYFPDIIKNRFYRFFERLKEALVWRHGLRQNLGFIWDLLSEKAYESVRFKDDNFAAGKQWLIDFAKKFKVRFPKVSYICTGRANDIDEEVAFYLGMSNCEMISIGMECGNEEFRRKVIKKGISDKQIFTAVELLKKNSVKVLGQWIIGFPGETLGQALQSLHLHTKLGDIAQIHIAVPFPKTEMHDTAVEMGFIDKDYIPGNSLYEDFKFHKEEEKKILRIIYQIFSVATLKVPFDMEDVNFLHRTRVYRNKKIGELIDWN